MPGFVITFVWIGGLICASVWYRRNAGKPIVPRAPSDAVFHEKWCSGNSLRNFLTLVGGARNCLLVSVQGNDLVVTPLFPFTLMFLPEIFGLDVRVPLKEIASVLPRRHLFSRTLRIEFIEGGPAPMELRLHDEDGFIRHLGKAVQVQGDRKPLAPQSSPKRYGLAIFRIVLAIWGAGALASAVSGITNDILYRRDGIETTGVIDSHSGIAGQSNDIGILSFSIGDHRYQLASWRGSGFYQIGDTESLYYMTSDPSRAREASLLLFDLMWLGLGLLAFTIAAFAGKIARRLS